MRNAGSSHVASGDELARAETVSCVTIDQLLAEGIVDGDRLGLVWIDVEGHELAVLAGARSLTDVPIVIEYQPRLHKNLDRLHALIQGRYGRVFDIPSEMPTSSATLTAKHPSETTDLLLLT